MAPARGTPSRRRPIFMVLPHSSFVLPRHRRRYLKGRMQGGGITGPTTANFLWTMLVFHK